MGIKLSGLISNMDTDSIVKELMSAQSMKKTKIENKKTKLTWKEEKWKDLNTKLLALYKGELATLKKEGTYLAKKVTSSDSSKVNATAGIYAPKGTHTVEVTKTASSQYLTGGKIEKAGLTITESTKLSDLDAGLVGTVITIDGADTETEKTINGVKQKVVNDNIAKLEITSSTTIDDFVKACKEAGLNASFDKNQKRLFINSKKSGEDQGFTITTAEVNPVHRDAENGLKQTIDYDNLSAADKTKADDAFAVMAASGKSAADIEALNQRVLNGTTTAADEPELVQALTDLQGFVKQTVNDKYEQKHLKDIKDDILTNELDDYIKDKAEKAVQEAGTNPGDPTYSTEVQSKITDLMSNLTEADKANIAEELYQKDQATYDADLQARMTADAANIAADEQAAIAGTGVGDSLGEYLAVYATVSPEQPSSGMADPLNKLGLAELTKVTGADGKETIQTTGNVPSDFKLINAEDAEFSMNGAAMTSSSNSVTVNGINLELIDKTSGPIKINVSDDTDQIYNTVKDFVKKYNEILKEMNDLYNADSARGYEPLSDEEKESMTDDQIKIWEKKIKDSLLRRDPIIDSITSTMRMSLMGSVSYDGNSYSLASLGITTSSDYTEKGLLHILGDSEDDTYSEETNKLKQMLEKDPEAVMNVLTTFGNKLYDEFGKKMGKTSLSSVMTFYNDKEIKNQLNDYSKDIKNWEKKLKDLEDRYYKQFTAMEVALSKLQSQSNSLASLMGSSGS